MNPSSNIAVGTAGDASVVVSPDLTVRHLLAGMPAVYSTPCMIFLMESAAGHAIQPSLPAGWVSVGVDVNIRHLAPTPVGRTVTALATVTSVTEKLVQFDVIASDGATVIGKGTHSRAPVELARFEKSLRTGSS